MRSALARHLRETRETRVSASRERQSNMAQRISFGRLFPRSRLVILAVCNGSIVVRESSREQRRGTDSDSDIGVSPSRVYTVYILQELKAIYKVRRSKKGWGLRRPRLFCTPGPLAFSYGETTAFLRTRVSLDSWRVFWPGDDERITSAANETKTAGMKRNVRFTRILGATCSLQAFFSCQCLCCSFALHMDSQSIVMAFLFSPCHARG